MVWPTLVVLVATAAIRAPIFVLVGGAPRREFIAPETAARGKS